MAHQQGGGAEDLQSQKTQVIYSFDVVSGARQTVDEIVELLRG